MLTPSGLSCSSKRLAPGLPSRNTSATRKRLSSLMKSTAGQRRRRPTERTKTWTECMSTPRLRKHVRDLGQLSLPAPSNCPLNTSQPMCSVWLMTPRFSPPMRLRLPRMRLTSLSTPSLLGPTMHFLDLTLMTTQSPLSTSLLMTSLGPRPPPSSPQQSFLPWQRPPQPLWSRWRPPPALKLR